MNHSTQTLASPSGIALAPLPPFSRRKRYAIVGTGGRVPMFLDPIAFNYCESAEIVGLCDSNPARIAFHQKRLSTEFGLVDIPIYSAERFDQMLVEQKPDIVIVCTVDASHDEYIVRSVLAGCDVITEKPLTTDEKKCQRIVDAVRRTGRSVRVTFNMRWIPAASKIKELILKCTIGKIKSVVLEYMLDTSHGADYFRRWHSEKAKSGGLLVHKSTHHFDLVNWWINSIPDTVFAFGDLVFYGKENALARGQDELTHYERYTGQAPDSDPFKLDLEGDTLLRGLYLDAEKEDGYVRDKNVFREGIDIEDSLGVLVKYRNGVLLTYSLTAFCPQEGFRVTINGDAGRIEYSVRYNSHIIRGQSNETLAEEQGNDAWKKLTVHPLFRNPYDVEIIDLPGAHGGGDPLLQEQMFAYTPKGDALMRGAGYEQGAASAAIGFAANRSILSGQAVKVADLVSLAPHCTRLSDLV